MKSVLKVHNMSSVKDVSMVRTAIGDKEGVVALQIRSDKGEIEVVYDDYFIKLDAIIEVVEDLGYTVL